ncbi:hypothetical protein PS6_011650 [Mucor atramentarius]
MTNLLANCQPDWNNWETSEAVSYLRNSTAKRSLVLDFFKPNHSHTVLQYMSRQDCRLPHILAKIKRDYGKNQLLLHEIFANLLQPNNAANTYTEEGTTNLAQHFNHNQEVLWFCKNKTVRQQLLLKSLPLVLPKAQRLQQQHQP